MRMWTVPCCILLFLLRRADGFGRPIIGLEQPTRLSRYSASVSDLATQTVEELSLQFLDGWNQGDFQGIEPLVSSDFTFDDTRLWQPTSFRQWERRSRIEQQTFGESVQVEQLVSNEHVVVLKYQIIRDETIKENSRGAFVVTFDDNQQITTIRRYQETADKSGSTKLNILKYASKVMDVIGYNPAAGDDSKSQSQTTSDSREDASLPEQYFMSWNSRDMDTAISLFDDDVIYDDTAFEPFVGKTRLRNHLILCADIFPKDFSIVIDQVVKSSGLVAVEWHMENGETLPFTNGCSFYEIEKGKIMKGVDFLEQSPPKPSGIELIVKTLQNNLVVEPYRAIPLVAWTVYMYVVFFSDGILPGANALQLEQRTWEEVRDLSLNFFLVAPLLDLPFSPTVHPLLEAVFNLLLSWAAMFAGFFSDDRRDKPNAFGTVPAVVGMQFLTSAFLLPYLVLRSPERRSDVRWGELDQAAKVCESRLLGPAMGCVGTGALFWGFMGRPEFGTTFSERWSSFLDLLSIDRVGSSFLVDLAIFALFQSFLIDDDLKRRGAGNEASSLLSNIGKYVPFFGLAAYLSLRPSFPRDDAV